MSQQQRGSDWLSFVLKVVLSIGSIFGRRITRILLGILLGRV